MFPQGGKTPIIEDGNWSSGIITRSYETCLPSGCYNFIIYDLGEDGIPYGGEVLMWVNGEPLDVDVSGEWSQFVFELCVFLPQCNMDYDGDGYIGPQDVLTLLTDIGCEQACYTDPNDDGIVNVQDLLFMLASVGPCPEE